MTRAERVSGLRIGLTKTTLPSRAGAVVARRDGHLGALADGQVDGRDRELDPDRGEVGDGVEVGRVALLADGGADVDLALDDPAGEGRAERVAAQASTGSGWSRPSWPRPRPRPRRAPAPRASGGRGRPAAAPPRRRRGRSGMPISGRDALVPERLLALEDGLLQLGLDRAARYSLLASATSRLSRTATISPLATSSPRRLRISATVPTTRAGPGRSGRRPG